MKGKIEMGVKNIDLKKRLATGGLFVVLLLLTLCSIGATFLTWQTTTQASKAAALNDLYQAAFDQLLFENSSLRDYILQPGSPNRRAFLAASQQSQGLLGQIESLGSAEDRAAVQPILTEQNHFLTVAQGFFALVDAHQISRAILFHNSTVEPLAETITAQIGREVTLTHDLTLQSFVHMAAVLHVVFASVLLAFAFGLGLIFLFLWLLRHYQQQQQHVMALVERDLQYMANVQLQLLPRKLPAVAGLQMYAHCRPARQVGGDFYTFNQQDSGECVLAIGDVSGKGLRAALLMGMVRTILHVVVHALLRLEPPVIASKVNELLYNDFTEVGMFATVFVGCYDPASQQLAYTNAGHSPVIYCPARGSARLLEADGPPIGVVPMLTAESRVVPFAPGDVLVMGTDGLSEAHNAAGELFGYQRLLTLVEQRRQQSAQGIAEALFETVTRFAAKCDQFDDQTVVIMKGVAR